LCCILTAGDAVDAKVAYSCTYELRPYLDLLLQMLLLEDSWQNHRIHNALKGQLKTTSAYCVAIMYIFDVKCNQSLPSLF